MNSEESTSLDQLDRFGRILENGLLMLLLGLMIGLGALQIVQRNFFATSFIWSDELLRILVLWLGLAGAIAASRDDRHITIDIFSRFLSENNQLRLRLILDFFTSAVCALLAFYSTRFVLIEKEYASTLLGNLPAWPFEAIIPVAFALISYRYAIFLFKRLALLLALRRSG